MEDRQTHDRPVIFGLVSLVILRNQSGCFLKQPVGYRVWILNQQIVVTSQISVKTLIRLIQKPSTLSGPENFQFPIL